MKIKAFTLVVIFMSFLTLPTILSSVYNNVDISMAYTVTEEEDNLNPFSEIFEDFMPEDNEFCISFFDLEKERISNEFLSKHVNALTKTLSPPPEQKLV